MRIRVQTRSPTKQKTIAAILYGLCHISSVCVFVYVSTVLSHWRLNVIITIAVQCVCVCVCLCASVRVKGAELTGRTVS